ncbi:tRNA uridine-5-carboxymethylaminomethyl(34) synthesis GTPase MnmE [Legionella oakridgensis]|uniref:tRNA modification GTPase MnmE n=2 Tax=Legionella oakridgensis TaxID=29423 RepID=W0BJ80_9GAMM|nr:tRNA uridine-5-carboxymethylaminomethyl(34) synthesis GTPase MnmE [Legionella oakridgensis]AHE68474.1 tRNA modification GTPase TrmE [Legionella oakridgensis ATCC 33761 = DSM 21215]ETO92137.1 tRNA modification GTPase TrmE [Legionella oakridgensis RV-2-2007]KTD38376.1 tRNA modification GTPase TrmE [Legionella oakridgensis]STY21407.1 GTPase [Legionella longbeachae]
MIVDTIAAIATPPGRGGVGIIRLSGPEAYAIALQLTGQSQFEPRQAIYCSFYDIKGELIDKGVLLFFKGPHSFTGEDVVELQVHGAPVILDYLLQECVLAGARLAKPGEFSERAFLNDKIDLTQAEAIADLIHASSQTAARMAVRSLQGDFSKKIAALSEQLINLRLYVEAAIDFPEEEIDFLNDGKIAAMLHHLIEELTIIRKSAGQGAMMREGLSIVIAGRPNAGKSTLINSLAGREVAIVTEVAGTTRDVMREQVLIDEIPVHLIDTAGLRDSDDPVEKEGIKRAWHEVSRADCLLFVMDVTLREEEVDSLNHEIHAALPPNVPIIRVFNKIDTLGSSPKNEKNAIYLSAKSGDGLPLLKAKIKEVVGYQPAEGQFLARRRHLQALDEAKSLLLAGQEQLAIHRAGELLADDLRLAHQALCEITGEFTSDDLLGKIFSSFCIGK